jgi:hypothetical protein
MRRVERGAREYEPVMMQSARSAMRVFASFGF